MSDENSESDLRLRPYEEHEFPLPDRSRREIDRPLCERSANSLLGPTLSLIIFLGSLGGIGAGVYYTIFAKPAAPPPTNAPTSFTPMVDPTRAAAAPDPRIKLAAVRIQLVDAQKEFDRCKAEKDVSDRRVKGAVQNRDLAEEHLGRVTAQLAALQSAIAAENPSSALSRADEALRNSRLAKNTQALAAKAADQVKAQAALAEKTEMLASAEVESVRVARALQQADTKLYGCRRCEAQLKLAVESAGDTDRDGESPADSNSTLRPPVFEKSDRSAPSVKPPAPPPEDSDSSAEQK